MQPTVFISRSFEQSLLLLTFVYAHPCPKNRDFRSPNLLAADFEIGQHLIFSFLGPELVRHAILNAYLFDHLRKSECTMASFHAAFVILWLMPLSLSRLLFWCIAALCFVLDGILMKK